MVNEDIPIFDLFQTRYLRTPMLIIALKELEEHFDVILATDRNTLPIYLGDRMGIWKFQFTLYGSEIVIAFLTLILGIISLIASMALRIFYKKS